MRPQLEILESRVLPDAMLAAAFSAQVVPVLEAQHSIIEQIIIQQVAYVMTQATNELTTLGPRGIGAAYQNLQAASVALVQAIPQMNAAFQGELASDTALLYQVPTQPNELAAIDGLLTELAQTAPLLAQLEQSWLQPIS
jgi:hypothetical protein